MSRAAITKDLVATQARTLKMPGLSRVYEALARQAREEHWGYEEFLRDVLEAEIVSRRDSAVRHRLAEARFPEMNTLDTFDFVATDGAISAAQIGDLARGEWIAKAGNVILAGPIGTGKTHLAIAALRKILEKGFECLFCDYQTLLNNIKNGYDAASDTSNREAYSNALECEVLLLDDLGAHRVTKWVEDTVTSIVTSRCNNRKALIATTNLPDPEAGSPSMQKNALGQVEYRETLADRIGSRARSRLFEMCTVIRMPLVEDYRLKKARTF